MTSVAGCRMCSSAQAACLVKAGIALPGSAELEPRRWFCGMLCVILQTWETNRIRTMFVACVLRVMTIA
jgi:hypothetical protein